MDDYIEIQFLIEAIENDLNSFSEFEVGKSYISSLSCPQHAEYRRYNGREKRREIIGVGNSSCKIICKCIGKRGSTYNFELGGLSHHAGRVMALGKAKMWVSYIKGRVIVRCGSDGKATFKMKDVKPYLDETQLNNCVAAEIELKNYCKKNSKKCNIDTFTLNISKVEVHDFENRINIDHGYTPERELFASAAKRWY